LAYLGQIIFQLRHISEDIIGRMSVNSISNLNHNFELNVFTSKSSDQSDVMDTAYLFIPLNSEEKYILYFNGVYMNSFKDSRDVYDILLSNNMLNVTGLFYSPKLYQEPHTLLNRLEG